MKGERKAALFYFFCILINLPVSYNYIVKVLVFYHLTVFGSAFLLHSSCQLCPPFLTSCIARRHPDSQSYAGVSGDSHLTVTLSSSDVSARTHFVHWWWLMSRSRTRSDMHKDQWLFITWATAPSSVQQLLFLCVTVDKGQGSYLLGQVYSKIRCEGIFSERHNDVCVWYRNPAEFRDLHGLML